MSEFDVEGFVAKLEQMGLKLTSVPLADGKLRINRWRMLNAAEHTQQIQDLWSSQIGDNQERIDVLAAHLARVAPNVTANRVSFDRAAGAPAASPSVSAPHIAAVAPKAATPLFPEVPPRPASVPSPGPQPVPGAQKIPGPQVVRGPQVALRPQSVNGAQAVAGTPKPAAAQAGSPKPPVPQAPAATDSPAVPAGPSKLPAPAPITVALRAGGLQVPPRPVGWQNGATPQRAAGPSVLPVPQRAAAIQPAVAPLRPVGLSAASVVPKALPTGGLQKTK